MVWVYYRLCVCVSVCMYACMCVCVYTNQLCVCACMHVRVCVHACACVQRWGLNPGHCTFLASISHIYSATSPTLPHTHLSF